MEGGVSDAVLDGLGIVLLALAALAIHIMVLIAL